MCRAASNDPNTNGNCVLTHPFLRIRSYASVLMRPFLRIRGSRDAESVVRVLKFRWNTRTRGRSRNLNMMAPGAAARSFARAARWAQRISLRRMRVVAVVIPIGTPLMDVVAHVVESEGVR